MTTIDARSTAAMEYADLEAELAARRRDLLALPAATDPGQPPGPALDVPWLQPLPDALLAGDEPAATTSGRTDLRLALVAAWQALPPR